MVNIILIVMLNKVIRIILSYSFIYCLLVFACSLPGKPQHIVSSNSDYWHLPPSYLAPLFHINISLLPWTFSRNVLSSWQLLFHNSFPCNLHFFSLNTRPCHPILNILSFTSIFSTLAISLIYSYLTIFVSLSISSSVISAHVSQLVSLSKSHIAASQADVL